MKVEGRRQRWAAIGVVATIAAALAWWGQPASSPSPSSEAGAAVPQPEPRLTSQTTMSAGVVQLMVTGNAANARGSADHWRRARAAFEQAIQRDERYAPAHAGLAQALVQLAAAGAERAESMLPTAITHADRAIELDPTLALAWQSLAQAEVQWTRDWPRAELHYRRAIQLAPGSEPPVLLLAELLAATGRADEAVAQTQAGLKSSTDSAKAHEALGRILRFTGHSAEAGPHFDTAAELDPERSTAVAWQVVTLAERGRNDEARTAVRGSTADAVSPSWAVGYADALAGRRREAVDVFNAMARQASGSYVPAIQFAYLSAALGERAQALDWIEAAVREHSPWIEMLAVDPILAPLRGDRRFAAALTALKLDGSP
jgi:tetratricopeptide (TPR) repeat protein